MKLKRKSMSLMRQRRNIFSKLSNIETPIKVSEEGCFFDSFDSRPNIKSRIQTRSKMQGIWSVMESINSRHSSAVNVVKLVGMKRQMNFIKKVDGMRQKIDKPDRIIFSELRKLRPADYKKYGRTLLKEDDYVLMSYIRDVQYRVGLIRDKKDANNCRFGKDRTPSATLRDLRVG